MYKHTIAYMVLIWDGNSEVGAHLWTEIDLYKTYVTYESSRKFEINFRPVFLYKCEMRFELPSNINTMISKHLC